MLIREGDPADCMYLVAAGRLRVVTTDATGEEIPLAEIGRGDLVGEMALITNRPRTATVYVLRDTHLLRLSTDGVHAARRGPPRVGPPDQHRDDRPAAASRRSPGARARPW